MECAQRPASVRENASAGRTPVFPTDTLEATGPPLPVDKAASGDLKLNLGYYMTRLGNARRIEDVNQRAVACRKIVEDICLRSYPEEGWKGIDLDPCRVRDFKLSGFSRAGCESGRLSFQDRS